MRSGYSKVLLNCSNRSVVTVVVCTAVVIGAAQAVHAQTYSVLHTFTNAPDGSSPFAGLTMDSAGNLYGTTALGGFAGTALCSSGCGTVFKLTRSDSGWTTTVLYAFKPEPGDGVVPGSRVIFGPDGALYGTTYEGGTYFSGTVFRVAPFSNPCGVPPCQWKEDLYSFPAGYTYGYAPLSDVVFDRSGNLYGTTYLGGIGSCEQSPQACGVVFEIAAPVLQWQESVIYDFTQQDGYQPLSGVLLDSSGNLYGTASGGGTDNKGVVYELTPSGDSWTQTILYSFTGQSDGGRPEGALIQDAEGNFYGSAALDGAGGGGTAFELSPSDGGWTYTLIHSFSGSVGPVAALAMDASGNLYGTTYEDGAHGFGNVFKLTKSNGSWSYTSLYDFTGGSDGAMPLSNVVTDGAGNLYGTAGYGGATGRLCPDGCGVVWEIAP
jgi:uncharacterized repeat protein (TIGR03803 family)